MMTSLYIHVPFCIKRCIYCDFVSGIFEPQKASAYTEALKRELALIRSEHVAPALSTLYIGGGTPSVLSKEALRDLVRYVFENFEFIENCEATMEANPGTVDREKLDALRSAGINRISMGVQSFNDDELSFLGRIHTSGEALQAVQLARDGGFDNIGIDLIYGIPGQTLDSWKGTLEQAVSLRPEHISTYELTFEKGTALYDMLHSPTHPPPGKGGPRGGGVNRSSPLDEDIIVEMYEYAIHFLTSQGFRHYEISNFAMPGFECRHNLNYWDRGDYFGAGLGAHSFIAGQRFHNTDDLEEYLGLLSENRSPAREPERISDETALSEALFLGLRKTEGIIAESFSRRYKQNILVRYEKEISGLVKEGLMELSSSTCSYETVIRLTRKGMMLSNEVFAKFLQFS